MPADMELQIVASLLRRGRSLDQLSTGLTLLGVLFGLAQLLMASITPICLLLSLWMIILGLLQKYWALERPSEALDWKLAATSPVFSVAFDAACWAFAWVDSPRRATRDVNLADCLKTAREAIMTIVKSSDGGNGYKASKVVTDVVERQ